MTIATGNFAELLWPGINSIFGNKYDGYKAIYPGYFETKKSDKAFEKEQGVTTLPLAAVKGQGSSINYVDPAQGYQKEYVNVTYALGASVTREMVEDEQYNYINSIPSMMAESMRQTEETVAANVLNNAFDTATSADGASIINASHTLVMGGTQGNKPSVAADLAQASLEQSFIDIMNWLDDQSLKIRIMPTTLVVPPALRFTAEKILQTQYEVGSADNTINPMKGAVKLVVNPWLTDTDAWFLITDANNGLTFYNRRNRDLQKDGDFDADIMKFKTTRRFSVGCTDWRGVYGSAGA